MIKDEGIKAISNKLSGTILIPEKEIESLNGDINLVTAQYLGIIGKPIKWIKVIETDAEVSNLMINIPKDAEEMNVIFGDNAKNELQNAENYRFAIKNLDRIKLVEEDKREIKSDSVLDRKSVV